MEKVYIGENFKQLLEVFSLKKAEIARRVDCSTGYLSEIEANEKSPGAGFLFSLNREFKVNINWLLTGEGTPRIEDKPSAVAEPPAPYETTTQPDYTQYEIARTPEEIAKASKGNVKAVFDAGAPLRAMKTQLQKLEEENKLLRARLDQTDHILSLLHITILEKHKEEEHKKEKEPA